MRRAGWPGGPLTRWQRLLAARRRWLKPWRSYQRRLRRHGDREAPLARIAAVDGLISEEEAWLLYSLAAGARDGCVVEIGSYRGRSTVALALGARAGNGGPVYAVDPMVEYTGPLGFQYGRGDKTRLLLNLLLAGVAESVWLLQTTSAAAAATWSQPIALLWIDGDHSYEAVRADVESWTPFLIPGGIVAFDDSTRGEWGVARVVGKMLERGEYERVGLVGKVSVLRRTGAARSKAAGEREPVLEARGTRWPAAPSAASQRHGR